MLDTLTLSKRLKAAGFSEAQADTLAEIQAEVIVEHLASKTDIQALRQDLQERTIGLRSDLRDLETRMRARFDTLEAKTDGKLLLLQWMLGLVIGGVVALIHKAFF
jgi:hypothetical protein